MDKEKENNHQERDSGYSEAQLDKDMEGSSSSDSVKATNIFDPKKKKNKK